MEVSGYFHASAFLPPEKNPSPPLKYDAKLS